MKIVLVGYMGSGKSTVGEKLADELSYEFIDLDTYIELAEQMDISTIFSKKGEIYFRKKEHEYLKEILQKDRHIVVSTGGGTPCYANNMAVILKATDTACYLKLSIPSIIKRLSYGKEERPLIADVPNGELPEFIGKHLFERSFFYNQANHIINCDGKGVNEIVGELALLSV